ncbi:MAG: aminotransferase class I/II-fold pyridoxal phosphate-dependent enzyme [Candidatus Thermoplasmatota archaeon]|nr:aminotransferase class I/II-fold pyridoxal phosphate-dependent enzyme [Candidatus Thermoplasmatota archaeon]
MGYIDLRSDTVTLPTPAMREAMAAAELGDDVFREDPTVNRLQDRAAEVLGQEAGLLVTSGTQGNLVSLLAQSHPGDEVILEADSHVYNNEVAGLSRVAGLIPRPLPGDHGAFTGKQVEEALRPPNLHFPRTRLLCLENTHNSAGGAVLPLSKQREITEVAEEYGLRVHVDGARIFNAAVALGVPASALTEGVDSLTFCLSKGLSCPVGSVVVGSQAFIEEARRGRKLLGGGMRQAGIIAAAGLVALDTMVDRLVEDHETARLLAKAVDGLPGLGVDLDSVQSNIVLFNVGGLGTTSAEFAAELHERGLGVTTKGANLVRCVTHRGIEGEHIEGAIEILEAALASRTRSS